MLVGHESAGSPKVGHLSGVLATGVNFGLAGSLCLSSPICSSDWHGLQLFF